MDLHDAISWINHVRSQTQKHTTPFGVKERLRSSLQSHCIQQPSLNTGPCLAIWKPKAEFDNKNYFKFKNIVYNFFIK